MGADKFRLNREEKIALILCVALAIVLYTVEAFKAQRERQKLRNMIDRLEAEVEKLKWVENDRANLEAQMEQKKEQIDEILEWLPDTWDQDSFRRDFTAWAAESEVEALSFDFGSMGTRRYRGRGGRLDRIEVAVTVSGSPEDLKKLFARRSELPRLIRWITAAPPVSSGPAVLKVEIFRAPFFSPFIGGPYRCSPPSSKVWLWPFKGRVRQDLEQIEQLCSEVRKHSDIKQSLETLENSKNQLDTLIKIINDMQFEDGVIRPEPLPPAPADGATGGSGRPMPKP